MAWVTDPRSQCYISGWTQGRTWRPAIQYHPLSELCDCLHSARQWDNGEGDQPKHRELRDSLDESWHQSCGVDSSACWPLQSHSREQGRSKRTARISSICLRVWPELRQPKQIPDLLFDLYHRSDHGELLTLDQFEFYSRRCEIDSVCFG